MLHRDREMGGYDVEGPGTLELSTQADSAGYIPYHLPDSRERRLSQPVLSALCVSGMHGRSGVPVLWSGKPQRLYGSRGLPV